MLPTSMLCQTGCCTRSDASLAIEEQLCVLGRPLEAVHVFKVVLRDVKALHGGSDGDVDRAGDFTCLKKLDWFANVFYIRNEKVSFNESPLN